MTVLLLLVVGAIVLGGGWQSTLVRLHLSAPATEALDPTLFATGSCEAFAPTAANRHLTVFLDAGHGGIDPGGVGTTTSGTTIDESHETLAVELVALAELRAKGFRVVVSRTTNSTVLRIKAADVANGELTLLGAHDDVAARDLCANLAKANVLVGIYFDAGSAGLAGSLSAYDSARPFARSNEKLAALLQSDVVSAMNVRGWAIPNDGVDSDAQLGSYVASTSTSQLAIKAANYDHLMLLGPAEPGFFTSPSQMPGAVIEPLYLTDPYEGTLANSSTGQGVIAAGIVTAIEQYFHK